MDPDGMPPLNLQRTDLATDKPIFHEQLKRSVLDDLIAFHLVHAPIDRLSRCYQRYRRRYPGMVVSDLIGERRRAIIGASYISYHGGATVPMIIFSPWLPLKDGVVPLDGPGANHVPGGAFLLVLQRPGVFDTASAEAFVRDWSQLLSALEKGFDAPIVQCEYDLSRTRGNSIKANQLKMLSILR